MNPILPERQPVRQEYVRSLFDGIALHYDFLNHFLSLGFDILWRKRGIRMLRRFHPRNVLDIATGTGDLAIEAARSLGATVVGVDIADQMLARGELKITRAGLGHQVSLLHGSAESLNFGPNTFDAVTSAFGVRNFSDVRKGLAEMHRVLKHDGVVVILEFSNPRIFLFRQAYGFYFHQVLPRIAGLISRSRESYDYLPKSVKMFPEGSAFLELMRSAGFAETRETRLTFGIATIYSGVKSAPSPI